MQKLLIERLQHSFLITNDLINLLEPEDFSKTLQVPKTKSISNHLWCTLGARESYYIAVKHNQWQGFSCSLEEAALPSEFLKSLNDAGTKFISELKAIEQWSEPTSNFVLDLLQHETMHEGQLIRLCYALERPFPNSSKWA
jgi:hypothetical protein